MFILKQYHFTFKNDFSSSTFDLPQKYQKGQADFCFVEIYPFFHCLTAQTAFTSSKWL